MLPTMPMMITQLTTYKATIALLVLFQVTIVNSSPAFAHESFVSVIENVKPSMVRIKANKKKSFFKSAKQRKRESILGQYNEFFKDGFDTLPAQRNGSGFIVASDTEYSWVLTAAHVVVGSSKIVVRTSHGNLVNATLLRADAQSDVALIKVESGSLATLKISESTIKEGQPVLGIGAAFGLSISSSLGIVSALGVNLDTNPKEQLIQTDVSVNPGSSGGALVNIDSEAVGLITKIYSNTGLFSGSSFAVPASRINQLLTLWRKELPPSIGVDSTESP